MKTLALAFAAAALLAATVPLTAAKAAPATERTLTTSDVTDVSSRRGHGWGHHHGFWHKKHGHHYGWARGHHYGWYRHHGPYMHHYGWYRGSRW
jgi:Ni/Co efflux regulator RcnB